MLAGQKKEGSVLMMMTCNGFYVVEYVGILHIFNRLHSNQWY